MSKTGLWIVVCVAFVLDMLAIFILVAWQDVRSALMLGGLAALLLLRIYRTVLSR